MEGGILRSKIYILISILILTVLIFYIYRNQIYKISSQTKLDKPFYTLDESYPFLEKLNSQSSMTKILDDIDKIENIKWKEWPEYDLWKNKQTRPNQKWTVFPIKAFGKWSDLNVKLCPNTYELTKDIPEIVNVAFSRLSPGIKLNKHQGWAKLSNGVLRCHLGLIVDGPAWIYCDDKKEKQEVGKWIVFDDSKIHYADNQSKEDRIVLILDLKRPSHIETGKSKIMDTDELLGFINEFNSI